MKWLKWIAIFLIFAALAITGLFLVYNEPLPQGEQGEKAEEFTDKILEALNKQAYDSIEFISWSYRIGHRFDWDIKQEEVMVYWEDIRVNLDLNTLKGKVYKGGEQIEDPEIERKAYEFFINDSFWLVAPYKLRDPGTERRIVNWNGEEGLLVTYTSGGVTPGDSYLWLVDENYLPRAWVLWVKIIPLGGLEFQWNGWKSYRNAWFASKREGPISFDVEIHEIR